MNFVVLVDEFVPFLEDVVHSLVQHSIRQHFLDEAVAGTEHRSFHQLDWLLSRFDVLLEHGQGDVVLEGHRETFGVSVHQVEEIHAAVGRKISGKIQKILKIQEISQLTLSFAIAQPAPSRAKHRKTSQSD